MQAETTSERRNRERRCRRRTSLDRRRRARRDALFHDHRSLAVRLARRFARRGVPIDDLEQVASLGLLHAAERFDSKRGSRFESFATATVLGELRHYFRDKTWDLSLPSRTKQAHTAMRLTVEVLEQSLGRCPDVQEIAQSLGRDVEDVLGLLEAGGAYSCRSIDSGGADESGRESRYEEVVRRSTVHDPLIETTDARLDVQELLGVLPPRQELIIRMHYWHGLTQGEIAERLGISQMHVSRLLGRSIEQLREAMVPVGACEPS